MAEVNSQREVHHQLQDEKKDNVTSILHNGVGLVLRPVRVDMNHNVLVSVNMIITE